MVTPRSNPQLQLGDSRDRPSNLPNILELKLPGGSWQNANLHRVTNSQRDDVESLPRVKTIQHSATPVSQSAESQDNVPPAADVLPGILLEDYSLQLQPQPLENTTKGQYSLTGTDDTNHLQTTTVSTSAQATNENAYITADNSTIDSLMGINARVNQPIYRPSLEASASAKVMESPLEKTSITSSPILYALETPDQFVASIPEPVVQLDRLPQSPAIVTDDSNYTSNSLVSILAPNDLDTNQESPKHNPRNTAAPSCQPIEALSTPNHKSFRAISERDGNSLGSNQAQLLPSSQSRFKPFIVKYFVTSRELGTEVEWVDCRIKGTSLIDFVAGISKITNNSNIEGFVMELKSQLMASPKLHMVVVGKEERWIATRARLLKDMIERRQNVYEILVEPIYGIERSEQHDGVWLGTFDELDY